MAEETTPATTEKKPNTTMGLLCYISILVLVPILTVKTEDRDDYLKTHIRQGIGLLIFEFIVRVIMSFTSGIIGTILSILFILICVVAIIGIVNAIQGKNTKLPILGDICDKIGGAVIK